MSVSVSVVVPAYNAEQTIGECLDALIAQDYQGPLEIIVVDDGSEDRTAEIARGEGVQVVSLHHRWTAAARNAGITAAQGDIVCFTDADCAPKPDWVRQLVDVLNDSSFSGAKGTYATQQKELIARFVQLEYEEKYLHMTGHETIDFVDTYSAAYLRQVLLENDCFDTSFHYLEDQELSFRLTERGYQFIFQPEAIVYHYHSDSLSSYFRKKVTIGYWKAQVVHRFPARAVKDSHTPQIMKVQMALVTTMAILVILAVLSLLLPLQNLSGSLLALALVLGFLFLLTTLPFMTWSWSKDRTVALASPFLLATRALALSLGYAAGTIQTPASLR